jgi:Rrf2 family transcriptional regulator, nitric oxide-sensitive transcriptional repressor
MKLTGFTDFSLRVLLYLSIDTTRVATIADIAQSFGISENHLVKVVHFLGQQGWINTVRGRGGGICLAMPPEKIKVGRVVRDTEGAAQAAECFSEDGGKCVISGCCRLKDVLTSAVKAFYVELDRYTLADIARNRHNLAKVLMSEVA